MDFEQLWNFYIYILRYYINAGVTFFLKDGVPLDTPYGLYSGNSTRRDHSGNPGKESRSCLVMPRVMCRMSQT